MKILWKRGEIAPLFHNTFYLLLKFHVYAGTRYSLRDKWFFAMSGVEIARVNCTLIFWFQKSNVFAKFQDRNCNVMLANNLFSFEQMGPECLS